MQHSDGNQIEENSFDSRARIDFLIVIVMIYQMKKKYLDMHSVYTSIMHEDKSK